MAWTSKVFTERVIKILTELEFRDFKKVNKDIFRSNLKMGRIEVPFILNIHYSRKKTIQEEEIKMFFADHSLQKGGEVRTLFIGYPDFSKKAREVAEKLGIIPLDIYDLLNSLADSEKYRENLKDLFQEEMKNYIPHRLSSRESSLEIQHLLSWVDQNPDKPVFIEGELGIGKTTLLKAMLSQLGKKSSADIRERIPFYVDLKNYALYNSMEDFIFQEVFRKNGIRIRTNESFDLLCEENRLIFLLDNLAKIGNSESEELIKAGKELKKLSQKGVQLVAVAPQGYFLVDFKNKFYQSRFLKEVFDDAALNICKIEPFTLGQIKQRLPNGKLQRMISRNDFLKDVCKVPVFLDIFAQLELGEEETIQKFSDIYKESIRQWKTGYLTGMGKEVFCEEMAKMVFDKGEFDLKKDLPGYLENFIQNDYKDMPFSLELLKKDLKTAFFIRNSEEQKYDFIHSSFIHYFIAKRLVEEIRKGNSNNVGLLSSDTVLRFVEDFMGAEKIFSVIVERYNKERFAHDKGEIFFLFYKVAESLGNLKEMPLNRISTQKIEARNKMLVNLQLVEMDFKDSDFRNTDFRFARCSKIDFSHTVMENVNASFSEFKKSVFNSANLRYLITKNSSFSESSFVKTNLFQSSCIRTDFSRSVFESSNLHGILAVESVFRKAVFSGVELSNGDFSRGDFEEAVMEDLQCKSGLFAFGNFRQARLKNLSFPFSIFHECDFSEANLSHVIFPVINLRASSFKKANLSHISFKNCDLRKTQFDDAVLTHVDFSGADLRGADLSKAQMCENTRKSLETALIK